MSGGNANSKVEGVVRWRRQEVGMHDENQVLADTGVRNRKQKPSVRELNPGPTAQELCALTTWTSDSLIILDHMSDESLFRCTIRNGANMELWSYDIM